MTDNDSLLEWARAAAAGDRGAAQKLLEGTKDGVYRLALRMLGHPEDAEDATQEILIVVLTQLGSFRGESAFRTWAWRIAAHHLFRVKKGRRETVSFESMEERLATGLRDEPLDLPEAEANLLTQEVRLRCTEAMLLSLDRESRLAYLLSDVFELSGDEAAAVLGVDPTVYRKRVSRTRARLIEFLRAECGIYAPSNRCRCVKQVKAAMDHGFLRRDELLFANHPVEGSVRRLEQYSEDVAELVRAADVIRHPDYEAPSSIIERMRELLDSGSVKLLSKTSLSIE